MSTKNETAPIPATAPAVASKDGLAADTARINLLGEMWKNCPHAVITYNNDEDEGPIGFSLDIDGCDPMELNAPTLRELIDQLHAQKCS